MTPVWSMAWVAFADMPSPPHPCLFGGSESRQNQYRQLILAMQVAPFSKENKYFESFSLSETLRPRISNA